MFRVMVTVILILIVGHRIAHRVKFSFNLKIIFVATTVVLLVQILRLMLLVIALVLRLMQE